MGVLKYSHPTSLFSGKACGKRHLKLILILGSFGALCIIILFKLRAHYAAERVLTIFHYQKSVGIITAPSEGRQEEIVDIWRPVGDNNNRHQIYSAYFDSRPEILGNYSPLSDSYAFGSVRIFAILTTKWKSKIYCSFKYLKEGHIHYVEALEALPITENHGLEYSAFIIMCPLTNAKTKSHIALPKYVAISYREDPWTFSNPTFVLIRYPEGNPVKKPDRSLAVCTGPLNNNYNEVRRLVEFVHIYRLMGAEIIYFYNLNATTAVNQVLEYFNQKGYSQHLEWKLHNNYKFEVDLRYSGILAALNECIYRATFLDGFKYVAIVDFDEILAAFKYNNLVEYIRSIDDNKTGSFIFRAVFFHMSEKTDDFSVPSGIKNNFLYTQTTTLRTVHPFASNFRGKYIITARTAIEIRNQFMSRWLPQYNDKILPVDEALLFHFRNECLKESCNIPTTTDFIFRRYGSLIWNMVEESCKDIFPSGICPIQG